MANSTNFFELVREFQDNIRWLNQILLGDEDESIVIDGVTKPSISKDLQEKFKVLVNDIDEKWEAISAIVHGGRVVFETKAALLGSGQPPKDVLLAEVWRDVAENNGLYGWTGSAWEKSDWDNVKHVEEDVTELRGPGWPGAAEYYETLVSSPNEPKLQIQDADRNVVLEVFGTEPRYEPFETISENDAFKVVDAEGIEIFNSEELPSYGGIYEKLVEDSESSSLMFTDSSGNVLEVGVSAVNKDEIIDARGTNASINERISKSITDYGLPDDYIWGAWYLRETRQRLRKLLLGEDKSFTVAAIGDSWTHNAARWSSPVAKSLINNYGAGALGWTGFAWGYGDLPKPVGINGNVQPDKVSLSLNGNWTSNYSKVATPDICSISTNEVGANIVISCKDRVDEAVLVYTPSDGIVRYKYDDSEWRVLTLTGNDLGSAVLESLPQTPSFTITIEVVSGTTYLSGLLFKNLASGVTFNKLGATGSRAEQWAFQSGTEGFSKSIQLLNPDLITILHGTNDQGARSSKQDFKGNIAKLVADLRSINPLLDILLIAPCENGRDNHVPMSDYQEAMFEVAYEKKCAYLNLQKVFGEDFSEYNHISPRAWFNQDLIHPEPSEGGRAIVDAVMRVIEKQ